MGVRPQNFDGNWMADMPEPVRVLAREEGNTHYPLPPNYDDMTGEQQWAARMNAMRMQETPDDLMWSWLFFRTYYLRRAGKLFYKHYEESPPFHYQMVRDIGRYPRSAIAAPRGTSKSTVLAVEVPLHMLLTRPFFNILLILSIDQMVTRRMRTQILYQLEQNPIIREDFGNVLPGHGHGAKNVHLTQTLFGSLIEAKPAKGSNLGPRPDLVLIDDPELDPRLQKVTSELTQQFDEFLSNTILPMLPEDEASIYWIGTLLTKRCFLNYVVTTRSDRRFEYWNRRLLDLEDDGNGKLLWPEKFPQKRLVLLREIYGDAYDAQCRNRPGAGKDVVLPVHPELSCYELVDVENPEQFERNPLSVVGKLRGWKGSVEEPEVVELPWAETVASMYRVLFYDHAKCNTPTSDYRAFHVIGVMGKGVFAGHWFSLDLLVMRKTGPWWIKYALRMAAKWRCRYVAIEDVGAQTGIADGAQLVSEMIAMEFGGFVPQVVPITYRSGVSKEERISALGERYERFMMKYPRHRASEFSYRQLWNQTTGFTGVKGCLQHDDAIDTVAMAPELFRGKRGVVGTEQNDCAYGSPSAYNLEEMALRGERLPGGIAPILGCDLGAMDVETLNKIVWRTMDERDEVRMRQKELRETSRRAGRFRQGGFGGRPWIGVSAGASQKSSSR